MDKVQHFEIPADDLSRARNFYEKTFGWKTIPFPMPDGSEYIGLHTGPTDEQGMVQESNFINGGMFKRGGSFPATGPTVAAVVESIDVALEKAVVEGGSVAIPKQEIAGMGWYAYIKDTEGNIIGVWQNMPKNS